MTIFCCQVCGEESPHTMVCDGCADDYRCHHGNRPADCDPCYVEADLAYDGMRERLARLVVSRALTDEDDR